jgi:hypothetical protein
MSAPHIGLGPRADSAKPKSVPQKDTSLLFPSTATIYVPGFILRKAYCPSESDTVFCIGGLDKTVSESTLDASNNRTVICIGLFVSST